ncbi:MAG: penicillin-binding protein activator [Paracoccaceae bacterium]|nr:penicillin-binding protein activator [Paracoccaceae bacterium]
MPFDPKLSRRGLLRGLAGLSALALAACGQMPAPTAGPSQTVKVALLVPSGSGQPSDELLATNLENAAKLAISDLDGVKVELAVYPTKGAPDSAAAAAQQAANEGARIILGPVYAADADAAGKAVSGRGINVLSFSNNAAVAGNNVFVLGQTFADTASRLVQYAVAQGKSSIAILHDETPAGRIGEAAINTAIQSGGASVALVAGYPFSQQGVVKTIPDVAAQVKASGAQAVFFTATTAGALPLVTQLLSENGVDPAVTQFIGLTRWDIPPTTLALPGVQHGWFALPDPTLTSQFSARYQAAYGSAPVAIAGLAYDGIAAIGALVKQGGANALGAAALTQPQGFVGVNGIFRFRSDHTVQRGLAIAQINNNQVSVIDPAPRSFGGAGF